MIRHGKEQHFQIVFQRTGIKTRDMTVNISPSAHLLLQVLFHQVRLNSLQLLQIVVLVLRIRIIPIRVEIR